MRYAWEEFGVTHKDLGYNRASDCANALFQRNLVEANIGALEAEIGTDPDAREAQAKASVAKIAEGAESGMIDKDFLDRVTETSDRIVMRCQCLRFWRFVLSKMGG